MPPKAKVTISIDPVILAEIDRTARATEGASRSSVIQDGMTIFLSIRNRKNQLKKAAPNDSGYLDPLSDHKKSSDFADLQPPTRAGARAVSSNYRMLVSLLKDLKTNKQTNNARTDDHGGRAVIPPKLTKRSEEGWK